MLMMDLCIYHIISPLICNMCREGGIFRAENGMFIVLVTSGREGTHMREGQDPIVLVHSHINHWSLICRESPFPHVLGNELSRITSIIDPSGESISARTPEWAFTRNTWKNLPAWSFYRSSRVSRMISCMLSRMLSRILSRSHVINKHEKKF